MRRVMPELALHPARRLPASSSDSFFEIKSLDFQAYYDQDPDFYGMFEDNDPTKRMIAVANYNNDLGEYWEFSDTGFVPVDLSNEAYKFGVNYVVYAMTH